MDVAPVLRVCFSVYWYNQGKPKKDDACLHCCVRALLLESTNECGVATARETTNGKKGLCRKIYRMKERENESTK